MLRVVAALLVVMIHVSASYVVEDITNKGNFIVENFILWCATVMISFVVTIIISKIPLLKKLVRG